MAICLPCIGLDCFNPDDLAAGIDNSIYSALDYDFLIDCPPGCRCPAGLFPMSIAILASTIPPVIPPIIEPGAPIILRLQGCTSLIVRTLVSTSTQADIAVAAQSMQAEWAGQQALCIALQTPGVNCAGGNISICNDASTFTCSWSGVVTTVPAGIYCQQLNTTGLTQAQVDAATALIKANLNKNAKDSLCPFGGVICFPGFTTIDSGNIIDLTVTNLSATKTFDSSGFRLVTTNGGTFGPLHATLAPGATQPMINIAPGVGGGNYKFQYLGITFFQAVVPAGNSLYVTLPVFCDSD
jgi:hypothetical protein